MRGLGTTEEYVIEENSAMFGDRAIAVHWRKPLRVDEIPMMANTQEVRERQGRA